MDRQDYLEINAQFAAVWAVLKVAIRSEIFKYPDRIGVLESFAGEVLKTFDAATVIHDGKDDEATIREGMAAAKGYAELFIRTLHEGIKHYPTPEHGP